MRLVSWNVRDLTGDGAAIRSVLGSLAADVVCLQEAPRRPGSGWRLRALARAVGLRHVAGGRGSGGTALLVGDGVDVVSAVAVRLPVPHWYTRSRGAVAAQLRTPSVAVAVGCLHLPLEAPLRVEHARAVRALVEAHRPAPGAMVVAGDFNEAAGAPAWRVFEDVAPDPAPAAGPTYPAERPGGRIDAVLAGPGVVVTGYGDGGLDGALVARASDHLPVVVDLVRSPL